MFILSEPPPISLPFKIKSYFLTTNNLWNNLPEKIKSKDIVKLDSKNIKDNDKILENLDNGLFINMESDEDD